MNRTCIQCDETLPHGSRCPHCHRASEIVTCKHKAPVPAWRVVDNCGVLQWVVIGEVPAMFVGDEQTAATLLGRCWKCRALFLLPAEEARQLGPKVTVVPMKEEVDHEDRARTIAAGAVLQHVPHGANGRGRPAATKDPPRRSRAQPWRR